MKLSIIGILFTIIAVIVILKVIMLLVVPALCIAAIYVTWRLLRRPAAAKGRLPIGRPPQPPRWPPYNER